MTDQQMNESRFNMWRAVVAMVHADGIVTPHEVSFVNEQIAGLEFSSTQLKQLSDDFKTPQDVYEMFAHIGIAQDKRDFFFLARALSWCDGDLAKQEAHIIDVLSRQEISDQDRELMEESRDIVNEVELSDNQWICKDKQNTEGNKMFGFLKELIAA